MDATDERVAQCLYCLERKHLSAFNREHVIPQSFGTFHNNFVLREVVCEACNSHFSGNIDVGLARDSFEAWARFEVAGQRASGRHRMGRRNIGVTLRDTEFDGAILELGPAADGTGELAVTPVPQIGLRGTIGGAYKWYRLQDCPTRAEAAALKIGNNIDLRLWGCTFEEAKSLLRERGWDGSFTEERGPEGVLAAADESVPISLTGAVTRLVKRAMGKIAMNYLAYHFEAIARMPNTGAVRRFIRFDEGPDALVTIDSQQMLSNVPKGSIVNGHAVGVSWEKDKSSIIGRVSLFGWLHYVVTLADGFLLPHTSIHKGHFFNLETRSIQPMTRRPQPMIGSNKEDQETQ